RHNQQDEPRGCETSSGGKLETLFSRVTLTLWFLAVLSGLAILVVPKEWKWRVAILFIIIVVTFGMIMMIYNHIETMKRKEKISTEERKK
ncbi:MAG: hypothetical protein J6M06_00700, partial [Synergistaceae bacterium]|nr:hypothetical protein [Synergistaceae bacterium]